MKRTLLPITWLLILALWAAPSRTPLGAAAPPAPSQPLPDVQAFGDVTGSEKDKEEVTEAKKRCQQEKGEQGKGVRNIPDTFFSLIPFLPFFSPFSSPISLAL
jgi:hypothetical protein